MRQQRPHGFSKAPPQYCHIGIRYQHEFLGTLTFKPQRCGHGVGESTAPPGFFVSHLCPCGERVWSSHSISSPALLSPASRRADKEVSSSQYNTSISPEKDSTPRKSTTGLLVPGSRLIASKLLNQGDGWRKGTKSGRWWVGWRECYWGGDSSAWLEGLFPLRVLSTDIICRYF